MSCENRLFYPVRKKLMRRSIISLFILLVLVYSVGADINLPGTTVVFTTVEQGKDVLCQKDDFVERMSPFDRAARMKTDRIVTEKVYLEFVGKNIQSWQSDEKVIIEAAFKKIESNLSKLNLNWPKVIYLIKTTGEEEGGAPYTRDSAIILPQTKLNSGHIHQTIAHELFHIFSRNNPQMQDDLYAVIGFKRCNEIDFPGLLKPRKLTNPDAPKNNYYIEVSYVGKKVCVVPILFSHTPKYDMQTGGEIFNYLEFKLLLVEKNPDGKFEPVYNGNIPVFAEMRDISGFIEKVGKNTDYIIHPEEILADNFAFLIEKKQNLPSPEITEKLKDVLSKKENREQVKH